MSQRYGTALLSDGFRERAFQERALLNRGRLYIAEIAREALLVHQVRPAPAQGGAAIDHVQRSNDEVLHFKNSDGCL